MAPSLMHEIHCWSRLVNPGPPQMAMPGSRPGRNVTNEWQQHLRANIPRVELRTVYFDLTSVVLLDELCTTHTEVRTGIVIEMLPPVLDGRFGSGYDSAFARGGHDTALLEEGPVRNSQYRMRQQAGGR